MSLVLRGGLLVDGTGRDPVEGAYIGIDGERIAGVSNREAEVGVDGEVIDLAGLAILPGLIDLHSHMGVVAMANAEAMSPAIMAAHLFRNAELCLLSGHTTAREVAGADGALREVIERGLIAGTAAVPFGSDAVPIRRSRGPHATVPRR